MTKKAILIIIDGWGHNQTPTKGDAIANTPTPWMTLLSQKFHSFLLHAHGKHVGLNDGQMGNSEVGHLTIGAGRIIEQDIVRINREISQEKMKNRLRSLNNYKNERIHIIGLLSDGGVHSHIDHIKSLVRNSENEEILIHAICDGRDTKPKCIMKYYNEMVDHFKDAKKGKIVSIAGRFYTMDRDNRKERIDEAYKMMRNGEACLEDVNDIIERFYGVNQTDEFIPPTLLDPKGKILRGEPIIFANFRADRMRQIVKKFEINNPCFTMTEYSKELKVIPIFEKLKIKNTLGEVISKNNITQCHIAETEKYAHVTYFLNGGDEERFKNEVRVLINSPHVKSYDLKPDMSTFAIVDEVYKAIKHEFGFIVCNIAALDMVGHTGNYKETCEAISATDAAIGLIYEASVEQDYVLFITADHGNAEIMIDENDAPVKKHTKNKVPFIICNVKGQPGDYIDSKFSLTCVAPTILKIMNLEIPSEMDVDLENIFKYLQQNEN